MCINNRSVDVPKKEIINNTRVTFNWVPVQLGINMNSNVNVYCVFFIFLNNFTAIFHPTLVFVS